MDDLNKGIVVKILNILNNKYKPDFTKKNLAKMFNVDKKTINSWLAGETEQKDFIKNYNNLDNLVNIYLYLNTVLQSKNNINVFLNNPNPNLNNKKPLDVLVNENNGLIQILNLLRTSLK